MQLAQLIFREATLFPAEWNYTVKYDGRIMFATHKNRKDAISSGVTTPIKVVPIPLGRR